MKRLGFALILVTLLVAGCNTQGGSKKKKPNSSSDLITSISLTSGTSSTSTGGSISSTNVEPPISVNSIEVSGYKEVFSVGDSFEFGGTVHARFSDNSIKDVTSESQFIGFDSSTAIESQRITVKYTASDGSSASTTYSISIMSNIDDLGKKTIAQIKAYMSANPVPVEPGYKYGIDYSKKVNFDAIALESINLIKTKASFGLNAFSAKIIFGDETGYIAVTGKSTEGGLVDGVKSHVGKADSKYHIVGYLSTYLGHPEIVVDEVETNANGKNGWDTTLSVTCDPFTISSDTISIEQFYDIAKDNNYNCAGHGYGEIYTFNNATCYFSDAGDDIYYLTDGERLLKVIGHNRGDLSAGKVYNVVGLLSMLNYSGAIYLQAFKEVTSATPVEINLSSAIEEPIDTLRTVKASQDDTETRYPTYTMFWSHLYKTTGYLTTCTENGKYFIGIRDTYYSGSIINGKVAAQTTYKMALIDNENFWNVDQDDLERYNPYYDYIDQNESVEVYYIPQQLDYSSKQACWKIFLLPTTLPMIY